MYIFSAYIKQETLNIVDKIRFYTAGEVKICCSLTNLFMVKKNYGIICRFIFPKSGRKHRRKKDTKVQEFVSLCLVSFLLQRLRCFVFSAALRNFSTGLSPWNSRIAVPLPLLACLYIISLFLEIIPQIFERRLKCSKLKDYHWLLVR